MRDPEPLVCEPRSISEELFILRMRAPGKGRECDRYGISEESE